MKTKLSNKLGPQAKKAAITGSKGTMIDGHLIVTANADMEAIKDSLKSLQVELGHYNKDTHQLSIHVPTHQLKAVVEINGVVYLEAATKLSI